MQRDGVRQIARGGGLSPGGKRGLHDWGRMIRDEARNAFEAATEAVAPQAAGVSRVDGLSNRVAFIATGGAGRP